MAGLYLSEFSTSESEISLDPYVSPFISDTSKQAFFLVKPYAFTPAKAMTERE